MHIGLYKTTQGKETSFVNVSLPHNLNVPLVTNMCHTHIFLPSEGGNVRVCSSFFINTLNIGKKTVHNAMKKKSHGVFAAQDERGIFPSANKTSSEQLAEVRRHIEQFPRMESHYVRKTSKRQYLSPDLSIRQMWEYYKESCKTKTMKPVA